VPPITPSRRTRRGCEISESGLPVSPSLMT
jgi:hypothetical protein